jgi:tetratricopeptide (TPR) repeat protein
MGAVVFQLPLMGYLLSPARSLLSHIGWLPGTPQSESESLYGNLTALGTLLPSRGLYYREKGVEEERTDSCRYSRMLVSDVSVQNRKYSALLDAQGRDPEDQGGPEQLLHARALADLGRHAEAIRAFETFQRAAFDTRAYEQERSAYDLALKWTGSCAENHSCVAEDFLAIGRPREALHWQSEWFRTFRQRQKVNLRQGEEADPASTKSPVLADAYDLNARIQAAMGRLSSALKDLDSAINSLPENKDTAPRKTTYYYHRALILAENRRFAEAAKACRNSVASSDSVPGEWRKLQCLQIDELASTQHRRR